MKESERLQNMAKMARDHAASTSDALAACAEIIASASLEIARQIAITREEAQNGKSSPFDRK